MISAAVLIRQTAGGLRKGEEGRTVISRAIWRRGSAVTRPKVLIKSAGKEGKCSTTATPHPPS